MYRVKNVPGQKCVGSKMCRVKNVPGQKWAGQKCAGSKMSGSKMRYNLENQLISHLKFDDMQDTWLNIEQVNCSEYCFGIMDSVTRSYLFFLV